MTKKDERVSYYNISDYVKIGYLIENERTNKRHMEDRYFNYIILLISLPLHNSTPTFFFKFIMRDMKNISVIIYRL